MNSTNSWQVIIPSWESSYVKSKKTLPKYWLFKDRDKLPKKYKDIMIHVPLVRGGKPYCADNMGNLFLKNPNKQGKPNTWVLNGQDLYNAKLNWRLRKTVAKHYHDYFGFHILEQIRAPIEIPEGNYLSISCDIYEVKRGNIPDVSNMWLLEKFFEDALQEVGIIPEDSPDYVLESGRKKYHWVQNPDDRKLVFAINLI